IFNSAVARNNRSSVTTGCPPAFRQERWRPSGFQPPPRTPVPGAAQRFLAGARLAFPVLAPVVLTGAPPPGSAAATFAASAGGAPTVPPAWRSVVRARGLAGAGGPSRDRRGRSVTAEEGHP